MVKKQKTNIKKVKETLNKDIDNVKSEEFKENLLNANDFKRYVYGKHFSSLTLQKYKLLWKREILKNRVILVKMFLRNGKYTEFMITPIKPYFEWQEGIYIIESECIKDDLHSGMACLWYHQDISKPLNFEFDIDKIIEYLNNDPEASQVVSVINPHVLYSTVKDEIITKIQNSEALASQLKVIIILNVVSLIVMFMLVVGIGFAMF